MTAKELRAKRARLITEARAEQAKITDKTPAGEVSEIEARFTAMITEAEGLATRAEVLDRLDAAEASLANPDPRAPLGENRSASGVIVPEAISYRSAFQRLMQAGGDETQMAAEARAALYAFPEFRAQTQGTAAEGGHMVPDEMMTEIVKAMAAWGPLFDDGFATVIKTQGGGSLPIPGYDDTAARAAKQATEGAALADTGTKDVVFTKDTLGDYLYDTEWLRVSIQLATGSIVNMEQLLGALLGERLGRTANDKLTIGTGTGEPLGIVTGAVTGVTVASNAAITGDEIQALYHSVDPAYRASPKFGAMFNDTTLLALHGLKDADGKYLLQEAPDGSGRIRVGAVSMKYTINQAMANIGTVAKSMVVGDMGKYFVRKIGNVIIGTDRGKDFFPGFGIAGFTRLDGAIADVRAIKALVHPV